MLLVGTNFPALVLNNPNEAGQYPTASVYCGLTPRCVTLSQMVRAEGLEPPRLSPLVPKTSASTNSATPALRHLLLRFCASTPSHLTTLQTRYPLFQQKGNGASDRFRTGDLQCHKLAL